MDEDTFVVPAKMRTMLRKQQRAAVAYSHGLRHQLRHGLELLHDDHELCQWNGTLLPLDTTDFEERIVHGTEPGYQKHRFYRVEVCQDCRDAHNAMTRAGKARARLRVASGEK